MNDDLEKECVRLRMEVKELREYKRLIEYVARVWPATWFGSFAKLQMSLKERMKERDESSG